MPASTLAPSVRLNNGPPQASDTQDPTILPATLRRHVEALATTIGERNCHHPERLEAAARFIEATFVASGYQTRRLPVSVPGGAPCHCGAMTVWNIEAEKRGTTRPDEVLIVGGHYDSRVAMISWHAHKGVLPDQPGTPGANDNASGVAATLALAELLARTPTERTIRFVAFVNEEPPFYHTDAMGSRVYARMCAADPARKVIGMISAETLGCYSDRPCTKRPWGGRLLNLPHRSDYVVFLSNWFSRSFAGECAKVFRRHCRIPARRVTIPAVVSRVSWSDDWAFWQEGYPAFAVTDTAFMRSDAYHELDDTPEFLDYLPMAHVVLGLRAVLLAMANPGHSTPARAAKPPKG